MTINPDELEMNNKPHKEELTELEVRRLKRLPTTDLEKEDYNG